LQALAHPQSLFDCLQALAHPQSLFDCLDLEVPRFHVGIGTYRAQMFGKTSARDLAHSSRASAFV